VDICDKNRRYYEVHLPFREDDKMKLNHDYVRDILLFIENNLDYEDSPPTHHKEIFYGILLADKYFTEYDRQELTYALELLIKEQFIECSENPYFVKGNLMTANIIGLTWSGHELLDNIRNDTIWNAVKKKASKLGNFSISVLSASAKILATSLMSNPNAIQNFLDGADNIIKMV
jgi:hypothetical protein